MTVTTSSKTLTVAENSGATPIGISAPVDSFSALSPYVTITVKALPTDGTVYLADGTTPVTVGEKLSVAQLTGLTFKPTAGQFSQSSTFGYTATDLLGASASGLATLTIGPQTAPPGPITTPPATTPASLTVAENAGPTAIGIAAPTDPDYSAAQLTVTLNGLPSDGTVYLSNGTTAVTAGETLTVAQLTGLTFKPTAGQFSQSSSLSYTVTNPSNLSAAGSATLAIGPAPPPTTSATSLTVAQNAGATAIGIGAPTDANYSAGQLTVTVSGLPGDGTVYLADGTTAVTNGETLTVAQLTGLTFKPTAGQSAQSSMFGYTVKDPLGLSAAGSATLAIAAATTAALKTTPASLTVAENAGPTAIHIPSPTDANYSTRFLTVTVSGLPGDGKVYLADGTTPVTVGEKLSVTQLTGLTFKPTAGQFAQSSSFTYTVTDPSRRAASGIATLAIGPDTTLPTTTAASLTVAENAGPTAIGISAPTDINYSASQLTVTVNGLPSDGTVYLADGTTAVTAGEALTVAQLTGLTFKPAAGQSGVSSSLTYTVTDPSNLSTAGSATLAIASTTPPATTPASLTVAENAGPTAIGIAAPTDATYSAAQLTVTVNGLPSDGTVYLANGTTKVTAGEVLSVSQLTGLTFKPTAGQFSQSSSFTYTVKDPTGLSAAGTATLAIGPDTTPPTTTPASLTVAENAAPTTIGITAPTDINYSASQLTVTVNSLPTDGTVYLANGTTAVTAGETLTVSQLTGLTFKPTTGVSSQSSTFGYTVTDPSGLSTAGSATLSIGAASTGGIVFDNTFGPGVTAAYQSAILTAEAQISSLWTNPITLNLQFDGQTMGQNGILAENSFYTVNVSYSQLKSALAAHATSSYAASAVAALPATDPNPAGGADWTLPASYAQMLGLTTSSPSPEDFITLNLSYYPTIGQDVVAVLEHEITEGAMGRIGGLGDNGLWSTMDLFRYNSSGVADYTDGRDRQTTYFSYDGGKTRSSLSFNNEYSGSTQVNGGDTADFSQLDVFGTGSPGLSLSLSQTDIVVMDVLGWNPSGASAASSSTLVSSAGTVGSSGATTSSGTGQNPFNVDLFRNSMASTFAQPGLSLFTVVDEAPTSASQTPQLLHPHWRA